MIGALDATEIERLLRSQQIGRLGVMGDDKPYIFPVAYGYDGNAIFIHSHVGDYGGLKVQLMRKHPVVCFEVEDITSPTEWRTVITHGTFVELTTEEERDTALAAILAQGEQPYAPSIAPYRGGPDQIVVYAIRLADKTGRYERDEVLQGSA
jgi:nitroimidazol reductase NimA-like FMN-containing flavoprotein (pyridoxamine 5'-phosphate oxidase superfamily)